MSYAVIEDFRGGLDRRRMRAVGQPGTLWECVNAHITAGGEVEKRKKFVSTYALPAGETFGLESAGGNLYVFGSDAAPAVPAGVTYQRLQHPDGLDMAAVLDSEVFDGKVYVAARYSDGSIFHFYDGELVGSWSDGIARSGMVTNDGIAEHLRALIDADDAYIATRAGNVITITAAEAGTAFEIEAETENVEGGTDDQAITLTEVTPNIPGIAEVLATGSFAITGGTNSAGVNTVATIKINGVEILGAAVDWDISNSGTAINVAAQINSNVSSPEYTATADGETVRISAVAGSGATPNNFTIAVTVGGDVTVSTPTKMTGGVTEVAGQAQVYTAQITGTFEAGDRFSIIIDDKVFGARGNPADKGTFLLTHKSKIHALGGSVDYYCALNDPTDWRETSIGAGLQNMASQDSGSETLLGAGRFQGNMVFFARQGVQVWYVDVDDTKNQLLQSPENVGTVAGRTVLSIADTDLFYLSDSGVRSIRQVTGTANVYVNDVGTAIDELVTAQMLSMDEDDVAAAFAFIEPIGRRYIMSLGDKMYPFSYFPASRISAWSTYELGVTMEWATVIRNKLYTRAGDTIYLYGGADGQTYDTNAGDAYTVTVSTPFLSAGKIATDKTVIGFDLVVQGTWTVYLLHDPDDESKFTTLGTITDTTLRQEDLGAAGDAPMFGVKMVCETPGAAKIGSFVLHYLEDRE